VTYLLLHEGDPRIESFRGVFLKMRRALGTTAFGSNEVRMPPGGAGMEHDESDTGHEEAYVVLAGSGTFKIDGEIAAEVGDVGGRPHQTYDGRPSLQR
jgi:uncharacterized cupin superfamily protein